MIAVASVAGCVALAVVAIDLYATGSAALCFGSLMGSSGFCLGILFSVVHFCFLSRERSAGGTVCYIPCIEGVTVVSVYKPPIERLTLLTNDCVHYLRVYTTYSGSPAQVLELALFPRGDTAHAHLRPKV